MMLILIWHGSSTESGDEEFALHALSFIRNTVKFKMVLFLFFPQKETSPVAYLLLIFIQISYSLVLIN